MLFLNIGVTGHRDLRPAEREQTEERVSAFFTSLSKDFPGLPLQLLTALAEGADQLVARVALSMNIPVIVVLPMDQDEYQKDFAPGQALAEFESLLARASQVITLPRVPPDPASQDRDGEKARQKQYAQLGIFISNHCQVLLALWDGKPGIHLGGTGQVVRYHMTAVMEGFEKNTSAATLLADNENDLVHHIVCSRDRPEGEPAPGFEVLQTAWFCSRDEGARSREIPEAYRFLLDSLQQFGQDKRKHEAEIARYGSTLLNDVPEHDIPAGAGLTDRFFKIADGLAIHYQKRVNLSLRVTYGLAVVMGLVFLLYSEYSNQRYLVLTFLLLFFIGVAVHLIGDRRGWHRKYLDYRALAEGLRVQLYWNLSGVVDSGSADFAYDNFLQKQDVELGWIRHVMRLASLQRDRRGIPDPGWVPWVVAQWVGEPIQNRGQLAYYSYKQRVNTARFRRTRILGSLCLWSGILIAGLLFLLGGSDVAVERQILLVLMGVLPLIAGVWDAYSHKKAEKELIKQYQFMSLVFSKARKLLDDSDDIAFQRLVLKALGQAALDEGAEWLLIHRERPPEHGGL